MGEGGRSFKAGPFGRRRRLTARLALLAVGAAMIGHPAAAQGPAPVAIVGQGVIAFDIPEQDLNAALLDFADRAGLQLIFDAAFVEDLRNAPLQGSFSAREGLSRLLAGTGLTFRFTGDNTVTLRRAASQDAGRPLRLGPIVVEGELQRRDLQDTQTSVAVVTGETLTQRDDTDLYDVIERTPGITQSFGEKGFAIRGVDQRGPGAAGSGLLVTTVVDGVTLPNNQSTFFGPYSTCDLDQVEVLRGPQSTQQGRNALAGAVVIRSNDPTYEEEIKLRGGVAQRQSVDGCITGNLPIVDDKLAARLTVERHRSDGFVKNPTLGSDDYDGRRQDTYRGKLRIDPLESLSIVGGFTFAENFGGEDFVEAAGFPDDRFNFSNFEAKEGSRHRFGNVRVTFDATDGIALESDTSYYNGDYVRIEDLDNTAIDGGFLDRDIDARNVEQELRVRFEDDRIKAVVGGYFADIRTENISLAQVPGTFVNPLLPPGVIIDSLRTTVNDIRNIAVFGEAEYRLTPSFGVIAGGRYDYETLDFSELGVVTANSALVPLPPDEAFESETTFSVFLPKVGVVYDWTGGLSTSFIVSRGYRAGGTQFNTIAAADPNRDALNEFDPETTWNYEFAVRSQWFDKRLTANANVFYTDWQDQQVNVSGPTRLSLDFDTRNVGSSTLFGGELDVRARVTDNLDLFGAVAYAKTEFDEFAESGQDFSGNEFPSAADWTAAAGASYFFDNGIELHSDVSYTSDYFTDAANTPAAKGDARFLVNARLGYARETWSAFVFVRNLFDNDYVLGASTPDGARVRTGEPRTVGAYFTMQF